MCRFAAVAVVCIVLMMAWRGAWAAPPERWQEGLEFKPHPVVNMSWEQIQARPDFVRFADREIYPPDSWQASILQRSAPASSARVSAEPDAALADVWVGVIPLGLECREWKEGAFCWAFDALVVFDHAGAGVTMVRDRHSMYGDLVPIWFVGTIGALYDAGLLKGY
jgi:hypothetical protein